MDINQTDRIRIVVTGHRPDKLGIPSRCDGYTKLARLVLQNFAKKTIDDVMCGLASDRIAKTGRHDAVLQATDVVFYTGMAQGWDQAIAFACVEWGIPFIAVVPCEGQERLWPVDAQDRYKDLLGRAEEIRYEPGGPYAAWKMQTRNVYMVDQVRLHMADFVLALWSGTPGGTANAVAYAQSRGVLIQNVWDLWVPYAA